MRFQCQFCLYTIKVTDDLRGYRIDCPSCGNQNLVPVTPTEEGCVIGDFIIKRLIGKGSIGAVYEAQQISLGRTVALKILFQEYTNIKGKEDFLKEARAAGKLSHPNLVSAYAVGSEDDGTCYMAMEFINGETVKERLERDKKIPLDESLHIVQQVAEALYYAWDTAEIIHRDVKPDNIMITREGIVKLTDLGLAMHKKDWKEGMEISGSPSYMSPEQFVGEQLDTRSDIYSLGITLYQMLTGKLPFEGETVEEVARQHFNKQATPLHKINPKIPVKVSNLTKKMMEKHPDDRYQDMEELLKDIWHIRQKTAPDKELVPDVHTISLKRLDYNKQKKRKREKKKEQIALNEQKKRYAMLTGAALIVTPLICVSLLLVYLAYAKKQRRIEYLNGLVKNYYGAINKENVDYKKLQRKGLDLIRIIGAPENIYETNLKTKVLLYLATLKSRRLEDIAEELKAKNQTIGFTVKKLKIKLAALQKELEDIRNRKKVITHKLTSVENKVSGSQNQFRKKLNSLKHEYEKTIIELNEKITKYVDEEFSQLYVKVYTLIKQYMFDEAVALLKLYKDNFGKSYSKSIETQIENLMIMKKLYSLLTNSLTKLSGTKLENLGIVRIISDGIIELQTDDGFNESRKWTELDIENAYILCNQDEAIQNIPPLRVKGCIAMIMDKPEVISGYNKKCPELHNMYLSVLKSKIKTIKILALSGKIQSAKKKAKKILNRFSETSEYKKLKLKLVSVIKKAKEDRELQDRLLPIKAEKTMSQAGTKKDITDKSKEENKENNLNGKNSLRKRFNSDDNEEMPHVRINNPFER